MPPLVKTQLCKIIDKNLAYIRGILLSAFMDSVRIVKETECDETCHQALTTLLLLDGIHPGDNTPWEKQLLEIIQTTLNNSIVADNATASDQLNGLLTMADDINKLTSIRSILSTITSLQEFVSVAITLIISDNDETYGVSSKKQMGNSKGYIRHPVSGDGDCGYTAYGIKRDEVVQLLMTHINDPQVLQLLQIDVKALLLIEKFFDHLKEKKIITSDISFQAFQKQLENYSLDGRIITEYINYVVKDKKHEMGWAHPCVLQALAHIQTKALYMWTLGNNENGCLQPHRRAGGIGEYDYAVFRPKGAQQRVDLLYIRGNHFEKLELIGFGEDNCPVTSDAEIINPLEIQKSPYGFVGAQIGLSLITYLFSTTHIASLDKLPCKKSVTESFREYVAMNLLNLLDVIQNDYIPHSSSNVNELGSSPQHHPFVTPHNHSAAAASSNRPPKEPMESDGAAAAASSNSAMSESMESKFGNLFSEFAAEMIECVNENSKGYLPPINIVDMNDLKKLLGHVIYKSEWGTVKKSQNNLSEGRTTYCNMETFLGEEGIAEITTVGAEITTGLIEEYKTHGVKQLYDSIVAIIGDYPKRFFEGMLSVIQPCDFTDLSQTALEPNITQLRYYFHPGRTYRLSELPDIATLKSQFRHAYIFLDRPVPTSPWLMYDTIQGDGLRLIQAVARYLKFTPESLTQDFDLYTLEESSADWSEKASVLMEKLQRPIYIMSNDLCILNKDECKSYMNKEPIFVHYDEINKHYNALIIREETKLSGSDIYSRLIVRASTRLVGAVTGQFIYISPLGEVQFVQIQNNSQFQAAIKRLWFDHTYPTRLTNQCRILIRQCGGDIPSSDPSYGCSTTPHQNNALSYIEHHWETKCLWEQHKLTYVPYRPALGEIIQYRAILQLCKELSTYFYAPYSTPREMKNGVVDLCNGFICLATTNPMTTLSNMRNTFFTAEGWSGIKNHFIHSPVRTLTPILLTATAAVAAAPLSAGSAVMTSSSIHPSSIAAASAGGFFVREQSSSTMPISSARIHTHSSTTIDGKRLRTILAIRHEVLEAFLFLISRTDTLAGLLALFTKIYTDPNSIFVRDVIAKMNEITTATMTFLVRDAQFTQSEQSLLGHAPQALTSRDANFKLSGDALNTHKRLIERDELRNKQQISI